MRRTVAAVVCRDAAWANLLSVYALSNFPPHDSFSASKAAAYSLAQCLRTEIRASGIRVINAFSGPIDDEWNQNVLPPKESCERDVKVRSIEEDALGDRQ